jgi:hypothetical protein
MEELFRIANNEYYIDLDKVSEFIRMEPTLDELLLSSNQEVKENVDSDDENFGDVGEKEIVFEGPQNAIPPHMMMDVAKWEIVRALLESLLNENGIIDESMGIKKLESQLSIPFRLAFNTLLINKIIKRNG